MIIFFVIVTLFFIIYMAIDVIYIKRFMDSSIKRVNDIFDGIKTFVVINIIDRIASAFDDPFPNDDDTHEDTPLGS